MLIPFSSALPTDHTSNQNVAMIQSRFMNNNRASLPTRRRHVHADVAGHRASSGAISPSRVKEKAAGKFNGRSGTFDLKLVSDAGTEAIISSQSQGWNGGFFIGRAQISITAAVTEEPKSLAMA